MENLPSTPFDLTSLASAQTQSIVPAAVLVDQESALRDVAWAERRLGVDRVVYSIRLPDRPDEVCCARCCTRFQASGPTGHANDEPICDLCLLECERDLGLVLALVAVVRTYAAVPCTFAEQHWEALEELGAFAWIYDRAAAKGSGPAREFPVRSRRSKP